MPRYELSDGSSNKFWDITLTGSKFTVTFGKIGTNGQTQLKEFKTDSEAQVAYEKLIAEKTKKGYREVGGGAAAAKGDARHPELEAAVEADPYDREAYSVLADWLQEQGDPRGELIALQLAGKDKAAKALIAKQAAYFLGPLAEHQKTYDGEDTDAFTWRFGYIHALRLSHDHYGNEEWQGSLGAVLDLVLRHPSGRFLTEITFVFNNDPNENDLQDLIDILAKRAPKTIRKLHFGDFGYCGPSDKTATGNTEISWYAIGDLSKLWKAVPKLQRLITQCGSSESTISKTGLTLGTLNLPELRHAEFRTGGLERRNAKAIHAAKLPMIEHLDIWYGNHSYGGDCTAKDVQTLLARTDLLRLRHLGLRNAQFTDDLIELLAKSKLTKQLTELDLSMGCLTDEGAAALAKHKDAFAHLEKLDVTENFLTKDGLNLLKGIAKTLVAKGQREADKDDDAVYRYPAVGE